MHYLRQVWDLWKRFGRFMGDLVGRIVLTVFYFTIFVPTGVLVRGFSDPLHLKPASRTSFWLDRETRDQTLRDAGGQS